jgi:hypothetical protein
LNPIDLSSLISVSEFESLTERAFADEADGGRVAEAALKDGLHINKYYNK